MKEQTLSQTFVRSFHEEHGIINFKLKTPKSLLRALRNKLLNISHTTYNSFVIECLFV